VHFYRKLDWNSYSCALNVGHKLSSESSKDTEQIVSRFCISRKGNTLLLNENFGRDSAALRSIVLFPPLGQRHQRTGTIHIQALPTQQIAANLAGLGAEDPLSPGGYFPGRTPKRRQQ
jgi:hypothetical protein